MAALGKVLHKIDMIIAKAVNAVIGTLVVLIILMVTLQVVFRYVFKTTMYGAEELPTYFMILCVYLAAGMLPKKEGHIDIDMIPLIVKSERGLLAVRIFIHLLMVFALVFFTRFSIINTAFNIRTGDVSAGLEIPIWYITIILPISGILMTIYYIAGVVKKMREFIQWK